MPTILCFGYTCCLVKYIAECIRVQAGGKNTCLPLLKSSFCIFSLLTGFHFSPPTTYRRMVHCRPTRFDTNHIVFWQYLIIISLVYQLRTTLASCPMWTTLKLLGSTQTPTLPVRSRRHGQGWPIQYCTYTSYCCCLNVSHLFILTHPQHPVRHTAVPAATEISRSGRKQRGQGEKLFCVCNAQHHRWWRIDCKVGFPLPWATTDISSSKIVPERLCHWHQKHSVFNNLCIPIASKPSTSNRFQSQSSSFFYLARTIHNEKATHHNEVPVSGSFYH